MPAETLTYEEAVSTVEVSTVDIRTKAEDGQARAQYLLGSKYFRSSGVPKDYAEAVKWYRNAAEQGYSIAQCSLGFCYAQGLGVPKDDVQAYKWNNLAAAQGQREALHNLTVLERAMNVQQITEAQRLSREFMP